MTRPAPRLPSRREVLAGGGFLVLAGCLPTDEPRPRASEPPEVRLRTRVAGEVAELGALYAAVLARFPAAGAELSPFAAEHSAHIEALRGPTPDPTGTTSSEPSEPLEPTLPTVPATLPAALGMLASAERAASGRRVRQAQGTTPGTARLLASIAACEAAHAALLDEGP